MLAFAELPDADSIRQTAQDVLSRPYFELESDTRNGTNLLELALRLFLWIISPIVALFNSLSAISPLLAWLVIILLIVILFALVAHIIYVFRHALRRATGVQSINLDNVDTQVTPSELEQMAEEAAMQQKYAEAVRLLLRASLLRLESIARRKPRRGVTNHEHLRRYRNTAAFEPLLLLVELVDHCWYGQRVCLAEDMTQGQQAYISICRTVREQRDDHRS